MAIISRVILAMFWFAIQTVNGGDVVQVMITAIWPGFGRLPNHIPADQGITTAQMVSFFLCEYRWQHARGWRRADKRAVSLARPDPLSLHASQQPPLSLHHQIHPRPDLLHRHAHLGIPLHRRHWRTTALFLREGHRGRVRVLLRLALFPYLGMPSVQVRE